jgi:hypothetical protein
MAAIKKAVAKQKIEEARPLHAKQKRFREQPSHFFNYERRSRR